MARGGDRVPIPGSERDPVPGSRKVGDAAPDERVEVTVVVRSRSRVSPLEALAERPPGEPGRMTREELDEAYGADQADLEQVARFAQEHGLEVVERSAARRSVVLAGPAAKIADAFGTKLERYESPRGAYLGRRGPLHVPGELAGVVEAVLGLDDRPQASPRGGD